MTPSTRPATSGLTAGIAVFAAVLACAFAAARPASGEEPGPEAAARVRALLAEKESRTPAQRKLDSNLLYAARQVRGLEAAPGAGRLATGVLVDSLGTTVVDVTAVVDDALLRRLEGLGLEILDAHPGFRSLRARAPLSALEAIGADPSVLFVAPARRPRVRLADTPRGTGVGSARSAVPFEADAINVSQGDVTHRANLARATYGVSGANIRIGVLSDGVDSLASLQASGDLPPGVTVLPGQAGSGNEGAAILEIVHDLAPNAKLFFATANDGLASMAQNIHDLRAAGCDILIDDVIYFVETPFQKGQAPGVPSTTNAGLILQAIDDVAAGGALYFTAAGNDGNLDSGTSGTWEGDFHDAGAAGAPITGSGRLHDFDPGAGITGYDALTSAGDGITLHWSDPLGGSANDYDLFVLNSTGTSVIASSTNVQSGTQDPYEEILSGFSAGERIVVVKRTGAADRFLHLATAGGRLAFATTGEIHGHSAPFSANAFAVAATDATGPYPNPFSSTDVVENFSSDGPRRYFFNADSTPITPGNFSSTGGQLLNKPDVTGADRVSCAAPTFGTFTGTSAAAPHAGAIAALVKSAAPGLTPAQIRTALTSTAIDIEAPGVDRDSGFGILDAFDAVASAQPPATKFFTVTPCRALDTRISGPALSAGSTRTFPLTGVCGIPASAKAVSLNATVIQPSAAGDLRFFPAGATLPFVSTVNYRPGQTRANNSLATLGASGAISVRCDQPSGTVHLILDVNGYFE